MRMYNIAMVLGDGTKEEVAKAVIMTTVVTVIVHLWIGDAVGYMIERSHSPHS